MEATKTNVRAPRIWLCPSEMPTVFSDDGDIVVIAKGSPFIAIGSPKVVEMDPDDLVECCQELDGRLIHGYRVVVQR